MFSVVLENKLNHYTHKIRKLLMLSENEPRRYINWNVSPTAKSYVLKTCSLMRGIIICSLLSFTYTLSVLVIFIYLLPSIEIHGSVAERSKALD